MEKDKKRINSRAVTCLDDVNTKGVNKDYPFCETKGTAVPLGLEPGVTRAKASTVCSMTGAWEQTPESIYKTVCVKVIDTKLLNPSTLVMSNLLIT